MPRGIKRNKFDANRCRRQGQPLPRPHPLEFRPGGTNLVSDLVCLYTSDGWWIDSRDRWVILVDRKNKVRGVEWSHPPLTKCFNGSGDRPSRGASKLEDRSPKVWLIGVARHDRYQTGLIPINLTVQNIYTMII